MIELLNNAYFMRMSLLVRVPQLHGRVEEPHRGGDGHGGALLSLTEPVKTEPSNTDSVYTVGRVLLTEPVK